MSREEKIIEYLQGEMNNEEAKAFQGIIANNADLQAEIEEYKILLGIIDDQEVNMPSASLKKNFLEMLEAEEANIAKAKPRTAKVINLKSIMSIAAILVIGLLVGININQRSMLNSQNQMNQQLFAEMQRDLNSSSVTGRIEAIQVSNQMENPDEDILDALIHTMENDKSSNVRLASVEALQGFSENEKVRLAMVNSLLTEKDPFVLIAMINTLSIHKDQRAVDKLEKITTSEEFDKFIKDEAHAGLLQIEKI